MTLDYMFIQNGVHAPPGKTYDFIQKSRKFRVLDELYSCTRIDDQTMVTMVSTLPQSPQLEGFIIADSGDSTVGMLHHLPDGSEIVRIRYKWSPWNQSQINAIGSLGGSLRLRDFVEAHKLTYEEVCLYDGRLVDKNSLIAKICEHELIPASQAIDWMIRPRNH